MRRADSDPPLSSVFAKVVRWINRSLIPDFPIRNAPTTLFGDPEAIPDAVAVMASYTTRFGGTALSTFRNARRSMSLTDLSPPFRNAAASKRQLAFVNSYQF
jgi:hypothetical protein